ncbi:MAG: transglycosylase SLT domain-containing protein [Myxococcaceae bacterium]
MKAIKNHFSSKFQEGFLWAMLICTLPANFWDQEVFNLPQKDRTELVLAIKPAGLDSYRREKLAELLLAIKPQTEAILKELYIELPETKAAGQISYPKATLEDNLARARVLTQWNRNSVVLETLKSYEPLTCEASYLRSLAYRRLRQYNDARQALKKSIELCEGDFKKKALFLNARIAAMSPSETALEVLDGFLKLYPKDSYSDDVLLWKAHTLKDLNKEKEAGVALEDLLKDYPEGDMREQALFERALGLVLDGQLKTGLEHLERLRTVQGIYWRGRLMLYPDPQSLKLNSNLAQQIEGKKILTELAEKVPSSYYGYFAARLVGLNSFSKPSEFILPKSSVLEADSVYQSLECFKKAGRLEEGVWIVDRLTRSYKTEAERQSLAQQYLDLKRPDKANQLMRDSGLAFPRLAYSNFPWPLSFSKAYFSEFQKASKEAKMPLDWVMGQCREESVFDAQVISWAGAVGLCQLLPSTARLSQNKLLNPETNIQVGALHLKELSDDLSHPLKIIAAYNAGKTAVKRWERLYGAGVPMDFFVEQIPYEQTRNYVKKVTSAWLTYSWLEGRLQKNFYSIENNL